MHLCRKVAKTFGYAVQNPHKSPFQHIGWVYLILFACGASLTLVTFNHIYQSVHAHKK